MLRNDICYPYPVLRTFLSDYKDSFFYSDIRVETMRSGYRLVFDFSVNNDRISQLINDGVLSYGIYVCCPKTMLRKMYKIGSDTEYIELPAETVHYKVEYAAYIIAEQDIDHYIDDDLDDAFKGINFSISKGSIFGIGESGYFDAVFDKDIIRDAESVIQIKGSEREKYMRIDLNEDSIIVWMPMNQSTMYKNMPRSKERDELLHAVVTIPALVEAIGTIAATDKSEPDGEELAERPWFLTIERAIKNLSETLGENEQDLYESPLRTAQIIMKNNSETVLKIIEGGF